MAAISGPHIINNSTYNQHVCTTSGTFIPQFSGNIEVLVVAGGGGGGMDMGGGGGGGGVVYNSSFAVTSGTSYTVTVGAGGSGAPEGGFAGQNLTHQFNISATQGGNSVFGSITAIGGGFGGSSYWGYTPNSGYGGAGGSGGGSSGYKEGIGSADRAGAGTAGQGNTGGQSANNYYSGGGGGAGSVGVSGPSQPDGGNGILNSILGYPLYWGGGGGGANYSGSAGGNGGIGGGGGGAVASSTTLTSGGAGLNPGESGGPCYSGTWGHSPGGNGGANTGGGGGGGAHYMKNNRGGNGGSGIVVIRYLRTLGTSTFGGQAAAPQNPIMLSVDAAELSAVEVLIVAGGGGGGMDMGGGGGGGGVVYQKSYPVSLNTAYTVTVGGGGAGSPGPYGGDPPPGSKGQDSSFGGITAIGGGGGGSGHWFTVVGTRQGQDGGCGGGDSPNYGRNRLNGGGSGTPGQGYGGGGGCWFDQYNAGGGGGAAQRGGGGGNSYAGMGGLGFQSSISGSTLYYGGGGGGSTHTNIGGNGGVGGGGGGAAYSGYTAGSGGGSSTNSGANGTSAANGSGGAGGANSGGGGGGGAHYDSDGANGGSGIVIVRYYGSQKATGGTITSSGGYTIHTFTSSGTFTPTSYLDPLDNGQLKTRISNIGGTYNTSNLGSITLNGSSNYLNLNGDVTFKTTGGWSVESVFKLASVSPSSLYNFIGASSINYNSWYWTVYQSKLALWNLSPGAWYYGSTTILANTWYHVVLVCNEAGTGYQFYLNGVAETGGHETYSWNASYAGLMIGFIGRGDSGNGRYFNGELPITKVYNYPLSATHVRQNFRALGSRFGFIGPTLYYDEGANAAAFTANWNNSTTYTMADFGGLGSVTAHGFTSGPVTFTLTLNNLPPHRQIRYRVFWHLVDSLDNETNQLFVMNESGTETEVYRFTKQYNLAPSASISVAGLTATWSGHKTYTYRPWAGGAYGADGYIDIDTGYRDHNSTTFTARHVMGADQGQADEAEYLSHVQVWIS